ncbi:MAG: hypothetical protein K0Q50_2827 [Vampirovibrio sp.]|jgi:hypothetical protein|nr:hypothetical protein [Vampirovibrio sp.]
MKKAGEQTGKPFSINQSRWLLPLLSLLVVIQNSAHLASVESKTSVTPNVGSQYECIDADGDEKCDNPPED